MLDSGSRQLAGAGAATDVDLVCLAIFLAHPKRKDLVQTGPGKVRHHSRFKLQDTTNRGDPQNCHKAIATTRCSRAIALVGTLRSIGSYRKIIGLSYAGYIDNLSTVGRIGLNINTSDDVFL